MNDLSPCIGCHSVIGPFISSPDGRRQVICSSCGMRGPYETPRETAKQRWEKLPRPAPGNVAKDVQTENALRDIRSVSW